MTNGCIKAVLSSLFDQLKCKYKSLSALFMQYFVHKDLTISHAYRLFCVCPKTHAPVDWAIRDKIIILIVEWLTDKLKF